MNHITNTNLAVMSHAVSMSRAVNIDDITTMHAVLKTIRDIPDPVEAKDLGLVYHCNGK